MPDPDPAADGCAASNAAPGVSVAVVVKDRREAMRACLDRIVAQTQPAAQIVVVDNGSTDGTWEMLEQARDRIPALRLDRHAGSLGAIRNHAARLADTPLLAFTDSDCRPESRWLAELTREFQDPSVGVVQGRTIPAEPIDGRWAATQDIPRFSGLYEACNVAYRRQPLLATGGFDETIGFFGEDTVAGLRLRRAGWEARWAPAAVVRHDVAYPGPQWHVRRGLRYGNWCRLVADYPELRQLLWHGWFLSRRTAEWDAAIAGVVSSLVTRSGWPIVAAIPYLWRQRHRRPGLPGILDSLAGATFDAARSAGLVAGCVRHRVIVL